jgi:hypothetical protein
VYAVLNWGLLGLAERLFVPAAAASWQELAVRAPGTALASALCAAPLLSVFRRLLVETDRDGSWPVLATQSSRGRP